MEDNHEKSVLKKNGITKDINTFEWTENLTFLDLSSRNIKNLDDNVKLPPKLVDLNLSHNMLVNIPQAVLNLENLRTLDISFNRILYFDDYPGFCHSIEDLNLANNHLAGPPYWIWSESPTNLTQLNLSNNTNITKSFQNGYFEELLQYTTLVTDLKLYNCRLRDYIELFKTFPRLKVLELGVSDFGYFASNHIDHIPCTGLDQCCEIERLNLSNTNIYNIDTNIYIYENLIEINLSHNNIPGITNEFCRLVNLETCILSSNKILYLPEDMVKLKKLIRLHLDSNNLCMLPENLAELTNLRILDLYDNSLYEISDEVKKMAELDLAQNYLEEPEDREYLEKKEKLRLNIVNRLDGRKIEVERPESCHSSSTTDDEELIKYMNNINHEPQNSENQPPSSPEDWDSDDYWVPGYLRCQPTHQNATWLHFVKKKMDEGNFCPMDMHAVSISDKVKYEKLCNPKAWTEVEGQFDDYSEDDS